MILKDGQSLRQHNIFDRHWAHKIFSINFHQSKYDFLTHVVESCQLFF
jgi:hypothetical protein